MKIAIISDMHLGYSRFEEDASTQAENAFFDADGKADAVICAGDVFDTKIPKLETIKRAAELMKKVKIPIFIIHGNHERRSKDMTNPVQLLASLSSVHYLHGEGAVFEKDGEKIFIFGVGSVPEELALMAIKKSIERKLIPENIFRILVVHQTVSEIVPDGKGLSFEELDGLPFDLIIDGHIHERKTGMNGKFLIPGSTVVTQLKEEETAPRGYLLFDTKTKDHQFVETKHRKFFFEEIKFDGASIEEMKKTVDAKIRELRTADKEAIIKIKITGKMREGTENVDFYTMNDSLTFIDNQMNATTIKEKIERIKKTKDEKLSVREVAIKTLEQNISGKITLFEPGEFFEKLMDLEEAEKYLETRKNSKN